jgi:hypothetical protein
MDYELLVKDVSVHGIKVGFLNKNLYKFLASKIPDEEKIVGAAEGLDKRSSNKAPILVTSKSVYITKFSGTLFGIDCLVIPLNKITSVSISGAILAKITINDGTVVYEVCDIARPYAEKVSAAITNSQTEKENSSNNYPFSNADEIRKFKTLLDDGIISQEEFDKKKKELLGL